MPPEATPVILGIEDEPRNAALLKAILRPPAFELQLAASLAEGRAWLAEHTADVILLDRHLPDGDGLSLVRELRAGPNGASHRILLVTASVLGSDRDAAEVAGCDAFVAKPIRIQGLLAEIRRQLGR
jgi:two-component system KDP operon response regulator KdpE